MNNTVFQKGCRVRVTSYSPFRGLKGTIKTVDAILSTDEPFCFYLIDLEGARIPEPVWFQHEEVELISSYEIDFLSRSVIEEVAPQ